MNYLCPECKISIVEDPRKHIICENCKNKLFLYKNGKAKLSKKYKPNSISFNDRIKYSIISIIVIASGTIGLINDDIEVPARRHVIHFHGVAAYSVYISFVAVFVICVSIIIDHYDKRNNEKVYKKIMEISLTIAIIFFLLSLFLNLWQGGFKLIDWFFMEKKFN